MWLIGANTNLVHSLFISFYECCQALKIFYAQLCIQYMACWGQIQLVDSLLLSFTKYLYNMKWNVMTCMEKSNVSILLRHSLNKNISGPILRHRLFFYRFPFVWLFGKMLLKEIWK